MPPFPEALSYLWGYYLRLRRRKGSTDMGSPKPIECPDIQAFEWLNRIRFAPWEVLLLERMDDLFVYREEAPAASVATRPMSEKLFDTLFA